MSLPLQSLLRLPVGLRRQILLDGWPPNALASRKPPPGGFARCTFTHSSRTFNKQSKAGRPPAKLPSSPTNKPPPPLTTGTNNLYSQPRAKSVVDGLLDSQSQLLLYKSPSHTSFTITSYLLGGAFLFGAYNWAVLTLKEPTGAEDVPRRLPWYVKTVSLGTTLFLAIAGTVFILAPAKTIKSIAVTRRPPQSQLVLSCEMANPLPFMKPKFIQAPPSEVFLDRTVSAVEIDYRAVPLAHAAAFTDRYFHPVTTSEPRGVLARLSAFNRSLLNAWPTLQRDIRRMFVRDGFTYVRFKAHGNWKLDLHRCELLDHGRPLERLTTLDKKRGVGLVAMMKRYMQ